MARTAWLLLFVIPMNLHARLPCPHVLKSLSPFHSARRFDSDRYWALREEAKRGAPALSSLTTPESLFAYRDSLNGSGDSFIDQIRAIEGLGGSLFLVGFKQSRDFHFSLSFPFLENSPRSPLMRFRSKGRGLLFSGKEPPKDEESLAALLAHYSLCLASFRIARATNYAAAFDPHFTARSLHHVEGAERHLYETLRLFNAPDSLIKETAPDPLRYRAYLEGNLKQAIERDHRGRLSRRWFLSRAQDLLKGAAVVGAGTLVFFTSESLTEGKLEARLDHVQKRADAFVSAYTHQRIEQGTQEYNENLNRPRSEKDPYDSQIERLLQEIAAGRDPEGKLQAEMDELKRRKELLKE